MNSHFISPVVAFTQNKYQNLDMIVDVYAMQAVWSSEKLSNLLGYDLDEIQDVSIRNILDLDPTEMIKIAITNYQGKPNTKTLLTKTGEKIVSQANIHSYIFEKVPHIAVCNVTLVDRLDR
jgi:hypothetical protein